MVDVARPERFVDASAYAAKLITGVRAVYGCGASGIVFPAGVEIAAIPDTVPLEPFTHTSELPGAPAIRDRSATVAEIEWQVPMRLYLDANDLEQARKAAAPFYGRYLTTFHQYATLGGHANSARITRFALGGDANNTWLEMTLAVWERLNLEAVPGPTWG